MSEKWYLKGLKAGLDLGAEPPRTKLNLLSSSPGPDAPAISCLFYLIYVCKDT